MATVKKASKKVVKKVVAKTPNKKAEPKKKPEKAPKKELHYPWGNPAYYSFSDEEMKEVINEIAEAGEFTALLLDGYEKAFMGFVDVTGDMDEYRRAVYSRELCIRLQVERDGMTWEDAEDNFSYNAERGISYLPKKDQHIAPLILDDQYLGGCVNLYSR